MALSLYIPKQDLAHRLHPGVKVAGMLSFFVAAFVCETPVVLMPLSLTVLGLIAATGAWANVYRMRVLFFMVFLMTFVTWSLLFRGGTPWFTFGPIRVGPTGMQYALAMALKLATFLGTGTVFLTTTRIEEVAYALTRLGVPYKLGFTMTLAFRLVPVFVDSALSVIQAQRSRGFRFDEGNFVQRVRRYVPVLVPVFIGALRRADGMAIALEARGFQSQRLRTSFEQYRFGAVDLLCLSVVVSVAGLYLSLWKLGYTALPLA